MTINQSIYSVDVDSTECPLVILIEILTKYFERILDLVGILANLCCIYVFASILAKKTTFEGHLFKYLLAKSVHNCSYFVCNIFDIAFDCKTCPISHTYGLQVWRIWFYLYVKHINELCSGLLDIAATLDCLTTVTKKCLCCRSALWAYSVIIGTFLFSASFYVFFLFKYSIVNISTNDTIYSDYTLEPTRFSKSTVYAHLILVHTLLRDVTLAILLLVLEFIILYCLRKTTKQKRQLSRKTTVSTVTRLVQNAKEAERKKLIMILFIGVNYLVHVPTLIKDSPIHSKTPFWSCFGEISRILLELSYITPTLIYFFFNTAFRRCVLEKLNKREQFCSCRKNNRVDETSENCTVPTQLF